MATLSNILAWRIPWTEELGGFQSVGSQRVGLMQLTTHILISMLLLEICSLLSRVNQMMEL